MKLIYHKKKHDFYSPGLYHRHWNRWHDASDELYDIICTQYVRLFGGIRLQAKPTKNICPEEGVRDQQRLKLDETPWGELMCICSFAFAFSFKFNA